MSEAPLSTDQMAPQTLEALRGSIAKWEGIVAGTMEDEGDDNCPLCHLFHANYREDELTGCIGCPVRDRSGKRFCVNTPLDEYTKAKTRENAQAEVDFLKSLLPKEAV